MQVKIFESTDNNPVAFEKEINDWLSTNTVKIQYIKQSYGPNRSVLVSVWFSKNPVWFTKSL